MAVYDCFCFYNEIDILEARLKILDKKIDYFVISEAEYTHSGKRKGFILKKYRERLSKWWHKIIYIQTHEKGNKNDTWHLENIQRNNILNFIKPNENDIIIISDVDEIPYPSKIPTYIKPGVVISFLQSMRFYFIDCTLINHLIWEGGTRAVSYSTIKQNLLDDRGCAYTNSFKKDLNLNTTLTKIRLYRHVKFIYQAGLHLTWMGGEAAIQKKLLATSHQEINTEARRNKSNIQASLINGIDPITNKRLIALNISSPDESYIKSLLPNSFLSRGIIQKKKNKFNIFLRYHIELVIIIFRNLGRKIFD